MRSFRLPPKALRQLSQLKSEHQRIYRNQQRSPGVAELAGRVDIDVEQARALVAADAQVRSLDETIDGADGELGSLGDLLADPLSADAYEDVIETVAGEQLHALLARLTDREEEVVRARFGFDGQPERLVDVGERFGLSAERVRRDRGTRSRQAPPGHLTPGNARAYQQGKPPSPASSAAGEGSGLKRTRARSSGSGRGCDELPSTVRTNGIAISRRPAASKAIACTVRSRSAHKARRRSHSSRSTASPRDEIDWADSASSCLARSFAMCSALGLSDSHQFRPGRDTRSRAPSVVSERFDPDAHDATDAMSLRAVRAASEDRAAAEARLAEAVSVARAEGHSWAAIGAMVGTSGEAARQRYGRLAATRSA